MINRCGTVAIIGRPNVGKSTLLNQILGQKISITARKPQTTRQNILGIKTQDNVQTVYVDTPGIHQKEGRELNRRMNKAALTSLQDVNVVIFMIDARSWTKDDDWVFEKIQLIPSPVILVLNKVDCIKDKRKLLPLIDEVSQKIPHTKIIPLSALKKDNLDVLEKTITALLPEAPFLFDEKQVTDKNEKFRIAEIVREKITRVTAQEVPHHTAVQVESMQIKKDIFHIDVIIWVEKEGQKAIVIGKKGEKLKAVGSQARRDIEKLLNHKVFLSLWVKVKSSWSDNKSSLDQLGLNH